MIKGTSAWKADPFHFRFYPGSIACNKKGITAPVLMLNVEREKVSSGLEFFRQQFVLTPLVQNKSLTAMGAPTKALSNFRLVSIFFALL